MKSSIFNRTYFIIDCDKDNKIIRFFSKSDNKPDNFSWIGRDVSSVVIKKADTDKNVNFYEISGVEDKIFNVDSFKTSKEIIIYVAKEINPSEGLYFKANYDALTRLPNRNLLNDRFNLLLSQSKRADSKIAILFIDLDGFKKINDDYGHNIGDLLLIEISKRLKNSVRDSDTIARWGGDEFIILLNNIESKESINIFANRMIEDCSELVKINESLNVSISLSIGISIYPDNGEGKVQLLELADKAMYKSKNTDGENYSYSN